MGAIAEIMEANERSRTWKERHAKGVPVKMGYDDMCERECNDSSIVIYGITAETLHEAYVTGGKPYALIISDGTDAASLRNFRYKPEWLEKKGKSVIPACKFAANGIRRL